jgi:hypothetical protein
MTRFLEPTACGNEAACQGYDLRLHIRTFLQAKGSRMVCTHLKSALQSLPSRGS